MKIRIPSPVFTFALGLAVFAMRLHSQVQAPDASPDGPFVSLFGSYSNGASAVDGEVLPGCTATAGVYDCHVQEAGEFYYPVGNGGQLTGVHPVILFMHGNHGTCGHPYNPPPGGTDQAGLPGNPRIDFGPGSINFTLLGACSNADNPIVVPSYRGYDYLANQLASWGYVVVSMDANRGIGGLGGAPGVVADTSLIRARGVLVLKTLQALSNWNTNGDVPGSAGAILQGHLDLSNVGLMGHSRGGEGVRAALSLFSGTTPTPTGVVVGGVPEFWATNPWPGRISGLNIRAIFEIAPTDAGLAILPPPAPPAPSQTFFNATGVVWNVLLPMCDGDVSNLAGVRPFDRAIMNLEAPPIQKSTYTVWGANHNFFNTQWMVTDPFFPPAGIPASIICVGAGNTAIFPLSPGSPQQLLVGLSSVPALFRGNVGLAGPGALGAPATSITFNRNFNPPFGIPATVLGVRYPTRIDRGYSPPGTITTFDDFTVAGFNSTAPAVPHVVAGTVAAAYGTVPDHDPVISQAANLTWTAAGAGNFFQTSWTANGKPGVNVVPANYQTLDIRVSRQESADNAAATTNFSVSLVGANGVMTRSVQIANFIDPNFAGAAGRQSNLTGPVGSTVELHPILQTVRIPLTAFGNAAFILPQLHAVRLTFDQTAKGAIFVTNIRLSTQIGGGAAAYPSIAAIPPVPETPELEPTTTAAPAVTPVVSSCHILSVTPVSSASELGGVDGYRIQVQSASGAFPVRDEGLRMIVGSGEAPPLANAQNVEIGYEPMVEGQEIFTMTTLQYRSLPTSARVILQFGDRPTPPQYWDCGLLP